MKRRDRLNDFLASGLTLWSFIKYRLYIHSPVHARRVRDRIKTAINKLAKENKVRPARSVRGKRTYIRYEPRA